jgi:ABC-2 type transport system permease protein
VIFDRIVAIVAMTGRRVSGDRRLPFFVIVLPIAIMLLVGTVFGTGGKKLVVSVNADPHDQLAQELVAALKRSDVLKPRHVATAGAGRTAVRRGRLSAAVIIPPGYTDAIRNGRDGGVQVIVQPGRSESAEARVAIGAVLARANLDVVVARSLQRDAGMSFDAALKSARTFAAPVPDFLRRTQRAESPFSYTAPSNLVLFAFITALITAAATVESRRLGVTGRVLASPTPAGAVVAAELVTAFLVALLQSSAMLAAGAVFFGVDFGSPLVVMTLLCTLALTAAAAGSLLATFVRTPEQAINFGPPIGIALGMLGGCMWPLESVGPLLRAAGHVVPQGWAMDAFIRLIFDHVGFGGIAGPLGVLFLYALVLLTLATVRLRRSVLRA